MRDEFRRCMKDESGQGMTEYILLVVLVALTCAYSFQLFRRALRGYYARITFWVSMPIP